MLPLVARLDARGEVESARAWIAWALRKRFSPALYCTDVALAFRVGDDRLVMRLTDGSRLGGGYDVVLQTYRARALQRLDRTPVALQVLGEAVKVAGRIERDGDLMLSARYLRARAELRGGRVGQALQDLHAIEAVDSNFLDVDEVLANLPTPQRSHHRGHIPKEVRHAVFERCGGMCAECETRFDIQYDHIIPVARGGSSNEENLQLLCGECNRRKSATLG